MRILIAALTVLAVLAHVGCNKEPQRGLIQKMEEKAKDGNIWREVEYYLDKKGRQVPHGTTKQFYPDKTVQFVGQNKDGKQEGEWLEYFPGGKKKKGSVTFKNGFPHGPFKAWYENGQLKVDGSNVRGTQDGEWIYYDETGKITKRETWKEGRNITGLK